MDGKTPELPKIADEIYEAAARAWAANSMAAVHGDWSARDQWPARLQDNENLHRIVDMVWPVAYQAGREDAARDALVIKGDRDITTAIAALDWLSFESHDVELRSAAHDLVGRLGAVMGSEGTYRRVDMAELLRRPIDLGRSRQGVGDNTEEQQR